MNRSTATTGLKAVAILGVFAYLLLGVQYDELLYSLQGYSLFGLFLTALLMLLSYFAMALRWQLMANGSCTYQASLEATILGSFLNMMLPAKTGELSKIAYLKAAYSLDLNLGVAILFAERFADIVVLSMLLVLTSVFILDSDNLITASIVFLLLSTAVLLLVKSSYLHPFIEKIPIQGMRDFVINALQATQNILTLGLATKYISSTAFLWFFYLAIHCSFFAVATDFELNFLQIVTVFVLSTVALSIPLTPGGIGTFHASIVFATSWYGIDKNAALTAAIALHGLIFLMDTLLFSTLILARGINWKSALKRPPELEP